MPVSRKTLMDWREEEQETVRHLEYELAKHKGLLAWIENKLQERTEAA